MMMAASGIGHAFGVRVDGPWTRPEGCGRLPAAGCVEGLHCFAQGATAALPLGVVVAADVEEYKERGAAPPQVV